LGRQPHLRPKGALVHRRPIVERKIMNKLLGWKNKPGRMPLLLYGARQVGKTHTLLSFGANHFRNVAYVNLETNLTVSSYFDENIDPERIIRFLEVETRERITAGETLVVLDEAQSCERALTALKYFNEQAPQYHIALAGSLLGIAVNREKFSFPVGNVESLTLYPLDFEEFLWAQDERFLADEIRASYCDYKALPTALHERALELYRTYLIVGGMPRAVVEFTKEKSLLLVPDIQNNTINDYIADMAKYASANESVKIRAAYQSVPVQLAKDNKKFQYKIAQRGGTSLIFGAVIDWLCFSGITLKCSRVECGIIPLAVHVDIASFKLYMGDTGLLTMKSGIPQSLVLMSGKTDNAFLGALAENYVAQSLTSNNIPLYYWSSGGEAEVDFVVQSGEDLVPIEVKAGTHTKSRSLSVFAGKYGNKKAIRISGKNFGFENSIISVPLYAAHCIGDK